MDNYSPIRRGIGLYLGFLVAKAIVGIVAALTIGLWATTGQFPTGLKWIARGFIVLVVIAGALLILSEI